MSIAGPERVAVQNPLIRYAVDAGWTYLSREEARELRRGDTGLLLGSVLTECLQSLNPGIVDAQRAEEIARRLSRVPPTIEGNLQASEYLRGLRAVYVESEKRERNLRVLDPEDVSANRFHVTDELRFDSGAPPAIRADVAFFVNGVPVVVVEAKKASLRGGVDEALDQIRRYHLQGPELMALAQLFGIAQTPKLLYGATWATARKTLFNWRDECEGDYEALVRSFFNPGRLMRALTDFILFTRTDGELGKAVLRPHQMRAVERVQERAADPSRRRALVWHTQGSGKTYTMITVARVIMQDPAFQNPTVLMIVDRNELEEQLFGNLGAVGVEATEALSKAHLRQLLTAGHRGLLVSTIHKFDDMPANLITRDNVVVLVDEAHRTTGGNLGNYLVGALPNATYVGFTGTPIDRTAHGKGTFKVFGADDARGYLDRYSIRESIGDGTTVPLHYLLAPNELQVDRETLEREFLDLADLEGVADVESLNRVLDRAVTLRNMLKNRDRVERVAEHAATHFRENVEPMGYKAMLVAVDREACALYKAALDRHLPPEYSEVVISHGHNDPPLLAAYHYAEEREKEIRKTFRRADKLPKILIVTEKLLTGFDAPVLYALYLDKPMRDHVLLQAIARANRPYEDAAGRPKPAGLIVDYVGIFANLEKALAFDSADVSGVIDSLEVLQEEFARQLTRGRAEYLTIASGRHDDKWVERILDHFRDRERRDTLYLWFGELEELFEILSPDPFLRPYLKEYDQLAEIYATVRENFDPGLDLDRSFLRKTAELVAQHTQGSLIRESPATYELTDQGLEALAGQEKPETVRVFNLIKVLHDLVAEKEAEQPFLIPIGERAARIAESFFDRQIHTREALDEFTALVEEAREAEQQYRQTGLSVEGFAAYWFLRGRAVEAAEAIGRRMGEAFTRFPHWRTDARQEQGVRVELYKALFSGGVKGSTREMVDEILSNLRRPAP